MDTTHRKLLTIITEAVLEPRLIDLVRKMGASGYTVTEARGSGSRGVRSAGWTHNGNIRLELICSDAVAVKISEHLKAHFYADYAMVSFVMDVSVLRADKF